MSFSRTSFAAIVAACVLQPLAARAQAAPPPALHPRVLTAAEIAASGQRDMLSAVRALRPDWLTRARLAFLDGTQVGATAALADIPVSGVRYARLLTRDEAAAAFPDDPRATVIQVIGSDADRRLTPEADARAFATPAWGVGPQLTVSFGVPQLAQNIRLTKVYSGGWGTAASLAWPLGPGFQLRLLGAFDRIPAHAGTSSAGYATEVKSGELGVRGVWGRSRAAHLYAVLGGGYTSLRTTNHTYANHGFAFSGGLGGELNLARALTGFVEGSQQVVRLTHDEATVIRHLRVGLAVELQRGRYGRQR